jgi:outer membrane immunogenic protein
MKRILLTSLALTAFVAAGPVSAADLGAYKAPYAGPSGMNWTGCYVGIAGGGGWEDGTFSGGPGVGGFFGGQGGCNYQIGSFVVGIEGEGFWSDMRSRSGSNTTTGTAPFISTTSSLATQTTDDFYDFAVRFGFTVFDRTLLYGKIGGVWSNQVGNSVTTGTFAGVSTGTTTTTSSWTTPGVLIGAGFEYAITNQWILRYEQDILFFDSTFGPLTSTTTTPGLPAAITTGSTAQSTIDIIAKLGVSYKFW